MKILNRDKFIQLPENTLYTEYQPCNFGNLTIKGTSMIWDHGNDYQTQEIHDAIKCGGSDEFFDILDKAEKSEESMEMDFDCQGRDGCYEMDQLYAVWEKKDIEQLIDRLKKCL